MLVVLAVAAAIVAAIGLSQADDRATPTDGPMASAAVARVVRIVDGDTAIVESDGRDRRVRFIGVDAPELARPADGMPAECGADAARLAAEALLAGEEIRLERDVSDQDRFGRLLRHPWLLDGGEWRLATELLVRDGHLEARSYPPDVRHDGRLSEAEQEARAAGAGVWGACGR